MWYSKYQLISVARLVNGENTILQLPLLLCCDLQDVCAYQGTPDETMGAYHRTAAPEITALCNTVILAISSFANLVLVEGTIFR